MGDFRTYSPDNVIITFGSLIITGFAADTFVEVERDEDTFMKYTGALGDVARTLNLHKGGKITLTLMAVAPINDALTDMLSDDETFNDAFAQFQMKDISGRMLVKSDVSWISRWPNVERGKESGTVQWVIDCAEMYIEPRGNVGPGLLSL